MIAGFAALALALASSHAALAQASTAEDLARARDLFVQGTELRDAGDAAAALEKLKAARDLAPNPVTAFELGRTYMLLGMPLEARDALLSVATMPAQPDESPRAAQARQDAAKLADDAKREIDRIVASVKASTREIAPAAPASPSPATPAEPPASAPPSGSRGLGPIAYAGLGVGAASFIAGGTLTFMAISKATSAQDACSSGSCPPSAASDLTAAKTMGFASILFYVLAAGGVAVGVVDVILNPPRSGDPQAATLRLAPSVAPGWAGVGGSF